MTDADIENGVFFNQDAVGRPVRTSLMILGMDYDGFMALTDVPDTFDEQAIRDVLAARDLFVVPGVLPEGSAYPKQKARVVHQGQDLMLDDLQAQGGTPMSESGAAFPIAIDLALALATAKKLKALGLSEGTTVFIEGGFAKNRTYCRALAALLPEQRFALTKVKEGTAFGAALTAWMAVEGITLEEIGKQFEIETETIPVTDLGELEAYGAAFRAIVGE
jgi:sugar (pentulose or hexulose) kinase